MEEWRLRVLATEYAVLWDRYCSEERLDRTECTLLTTQLAEIRDSVEVGRGVLFFAMVDAILLEVRPLAVGGDG